MMATENARYVYTSDERACLERCIKNNMNIALEGTVQIINVLMMNDTLKFEMDSSDGISLRDLNTRQVLTSIPRREILERAKNI